MSDYQIIFSDLDGTLLDATRHVPADTALCIRALHGRGVPFVIVTARMPAAAYPLQAQIGTGGPLIAYGGALALDENSRLVRSLRLSAEDMAAVLDFMRRQPFDAACSVYADDNWYAENPVDPRIVEESLITGVPVQPLSAAPKELCPHKIFYITGENTAPAVMQALQTHFKELTVSYSGWGHIEIMHPQATKAEGMQSICAHLGIPLKKAVAFGDSLNDVPMLCAAGLGVAVDNAPAEVKKAADRVCPSNDRQGVKQTLERLFDV